MAEIKEVIEDFGDNVSKVVKNKKFLVVVLVVAGLAIASGYLKYRKEDESDDFTAYEAVGYAGYPVVNGGGSSTTEGDSSYYTQWDTFLNDIMTEYESELDTMQTNITELSDRLKTSEELSTEQAYLLQRQNDVSQMKANSELWHNVSDQTLKDNLHKENAEIAEKYGFTFDEVSGNWLEKGTAVYSLAWQRANTLETPTPKPTNTATVEFDNNKDYQQAIIDAINKGSSADVINQLNAQRDAKIAANNITNANSGFDRNIDYQSLINKAQSMGVNENVIKNLQEQRNAKVAATK